MEFGSEIRRRNPEAFNKKNCISRRKGVYLQNGKLTPYIMKAHLFLSFSALCMIMCIQAQGQTYYNFAVGTEVSGVYNSSHAIVRPIDASRAVAYYGGFGAANSVSA